ncbi:MAG: ABC transporter permease, partial [Veillonella sp.]
MNDDVIEVSTVHSWTRRKKMLLLASFVSVVLVLITIAGALMPEESYAINYGNKYAEPSLQYIFGTDHMGRDMLYRCIKGLSISIQVG